MTEQAALEQLFGPFSPHGSLIAVFDRAEDRDTAQQAIQELGVMDVRAVSDREVLLKQAVGDRGDFAVGLADVSLDQYLDAANDGQSFLVVHLFDSGQLEIASPARRCYATMPTSCAAIQPNSSTTGHTRWC